jgi:hypothetical protein
VFWAAQDISERKHHEETQQLLLNELSHRVKNTLAVVQAIGQQTLRQTKDPAEFTASFGERIQSLSRMHGLLSQSGWQAVDLQEIARDQLATHEVSRIDISGPPVRLKPEVALQCCAAQSTSSSWQTPAIWSWWATGPCWHDLSPKHCPIQRRMAPGGAILPSRPARACGRRAQRRSRTAPLRGRPEGLSLTDASTAAVVRRDWPRDGARSRLGRESLDELEHRDPRLGLRLEPTPVEKLAFQRGEEALAHRIVVGVSAGRSEGPLSQ